MSPLVERIVQLALVALGAGGALAWAFPPQPQPWLIVPALAGLLLALSRATPLEWCVAGVLTGASWFHVVPRAVAGHWGAWPALVMYFWLCLALGATLGLAGWLSRRWLLQHRLFAVALIWPAAGLAWEHFGTTPLLLAPACAESPAWLALTPMVGAIGFDAIIWSLAGCLAALVGAHRRRALLVGALAITALWLARFAPSPPPLGALHVAGLQPDVSTRDFERATWSLFERRRIEHRLDDMTRDAVARGPDLVVWPEGGNELANERLSRRAAILRTLTASTSVTLLAGSRSVGPHGRIANTASTWTQAGLQEVVVKAHPVPFAESMLEAGPPKVVAVGAARVGVSICFDAIFAGHARALAARGAEVIVATSDDASLVDTRLAAWHAAFARVRAIEVRRPLVFVSNAGPSFASDAQGRLIAQVPLGARGILTATVERVASESGAAAAPLAFFLLMIALVNRRRAPAPVPIRARTAAWAALIAVVVLFTAGGAGVIASRSTAASAPPRDDLSGLFKQRHQRSCGAAALAFALTYLGDELFEGDVLDAGAPIDPAGYSMAELARFATTRGFAATGWAAPLDALEHLGGGVALALFDVGHFVAVLSVSDAHVLLFDPALGQTVQVPRAEFESLYSGRALFVVPGVPGAGRSS